MLGSSSFGLVGEFHFRVRSEVTEDAIGNPYYFFELSGGASVEARIFGLSFGVGLDFSFTAEVQLDDDVHDLHPDLPKANAKIYDSLLIRHWDQWKEGRYSHLFVVGADGGEPKDLMLGERFDTPVKPFGAAAPAARGSARRSRQPA